MDVKLYNKCYKRYEPRTEDIPAGVADPYTEMIKARRLKQLPEDGHAANDIRPVKHVKLVVIDLIEKLKTNYHKSRHFIFSLHFVRVSSQQFSRGVNILFPYSKSEQLEAKR